jgi:hypothetical protein
MFLFFTFSFFVVFVLFQVVTTSKDLPRKEPNCSRHGGSTSETVDSCLSYLIEVSEKAFRLLVPRYGMVFEEIQQRLDQELEEYKDNEERERTPPSHWYHLPKQSRWAPYR